MRRLKELREQRHKTQKEVAAYLGLDYKRYNHYETGRSEPDIETIRQFSLFFGASTDYILELTDEPFGSNCALAAYISNVRSCKNQSHEEFAAECGIDVFLLRQIETGFVKTDEGDRLHQVGSLSTEDIKKIGDAMAVDWRYLACLYDGINPHRVNGVRIPGDDLTKPQNLTLLDINLQLFDNAAPTGLDGLDEEEALLLENYRAMNKTGRDKLVEHSTDLVQSGNYFKNISSQKNA